MATHKGRKEPKENNMGLGGFLGGLASFLETIGELAEKEELRKGGEFTVGEGDKQRKGVYGFSVKVGLGEEGMKVEPFGNVHKDRSTGKTIVDEIREPLVDVFDEPDHVLILAEMPGVGAEDVQLELKDDILILSATRGDKKYHKELLLPGTFTPAQLSHQSRNGILEVRLRK